MLSCIRLVRDLSESRPKTLGLRPIGSVAGWFARGSWQRNQGSPGCAAPRGMTAYDLSRRLFSRQAADFCLPDGVPARRIA